MPASSPEKAGVATPHERLALADRIKRDINAACVRLYEETEPRTHLGASIIGDECLRKSWYGFRWFTLPRFDGRMLRLFNRGHREEERFVAWLKEAGFRVWEVDENTGKQFRIHACQGHFGGSLDGGALTPYPELADVPLLCEFKTHNTTSFAKLKKGGVKVAKPQHFRQMCTYGSGYRFYFGLYLAINKNDDELYVEIVELDWSLGDDMTKRGFDVVTSRVPPPKIAQRADFFACKTCEHARTCHYNQPPERNCRSCTNAYPADNAEWFCTMYQQNIPAHVIKVGCDRWDRLA